MLVASSRPTPCCGASRWIASFTFVKVTGDLRAICSATSPDTRELFRDRLPGVLTSRVTRPRTPSTHREHVHLERAAAGHRDFGGDRLRHHRERQDGADAQPHCRHRVVAMFASRPPEGRCIMSSPTRARRSTARWSTSSATCRWCGILRAAARASPLRHHHRPRDDRAQRSVLYLNAAHPACAVHGALTICLLGWAISLWQSGSIRPATWCSPVRSAFRCCTRRAIWRRARRCHAARRTPHEALQTLLVPHELRDIRSSAADRLGAKRDIRPCVIHVSRRRQIFDGLSLSLEPGQRVGSSGIRVAASRRCLLAATLYECKAGAS